MADLKKCPFCNSNEESFGDSACITHDDTCFMLSLGVCDFNKTWIYCQADIEQWNNRPISKEVAHSASDNNAMVPCPWYQGMGKPCVRSYMYECKRLPCVYPAAQHQ